jgi:adenosylcobinamide-GDP ribazoletransferase
MVAATVRPFTAYALTLAAGAFAVALTWLTWSRSPAQPTGGGEAGPDVLALVGAGAAVGLAVVVAVALTRRARTALGGITGDTLGAGVELALPAVLLTLALSC